VLRQAGDVNGLREFYERRLGVTEASPARLELHLRLGQLGESAPETLPLALSAYQAALALEPPSSSRSRVCAGSGSGWERPRQAPSRGRRRLPPPGAARGPSRPGWRPGACDERSPEARARHRRLRTGAGPRPRSTSRAAEAVESLLARKGGAAELASLNERRGQTRLASGDRPGAADEFFKAAQGWLDGVGDRGRALTALGRALEAEPEHADALELRAVPPGIRDAGPTPAEALEARLRIGGGRRDPRRAPAPSRRHLPGAPGPVRRAVAAFNAALASVRSAEPLDRLATLHRASRNWTGAVDCPASAPVDGEPSGGTGPGLPPPRGGAERGIRRWRALGDRGEGGVPRCCSRSPRRSIASFPSSSGEGGPPCCSSCSTSAPRPPALPQPRPASGSGSPSSTSAHSGTCPGRWAACRTAVELDPGSVEARAALADMLSKDPGSADLAGTPTARSSPSTRCAPQPRDALRDLGLAAHAGPGASVPPPPARS
jgi:hypothetical protein